MPSVRFAAPLLVLAAAAPIPACAQDREQLCRDIQNRPMRVGQWATYAWTGGRTDGTSMRFAIVGAEGRDSTTYYWYEMTTDDPKRGAKGKTVIQMLVPGLGYQAGGVRALVMKNGDEPAARMPDQLVTMMGPRAGSNITAEMTRSCREMDVIGWERVTVPAGTFRALHFRHPREGTEAWVRPELYFAMVKVVTKDGSTMVLTGHGAGAKSSITETPREMMGPRR